MINRAVLTGRLTKDPELRYTQSGTAVCTFNLAVDRQFRNQNGDRDADFVSCVIWRKSAENFSNFTHKGSLVGIEGRIQTRNYENQQGERVYVTEVVVDNFALLESKSNRNTPKQAPQGAPQGQPNNYAPQAPQGNFAPQQGNYTQPQQNGNQGGYGAPQGVQVSDAELPF